MQLQSHDGVKNPRPLCLTLRTKYEFSTRWKYLKSHLAEGKGLSQLTTLTRNTEESQPQDLHIDHGHFEQPHPDISKTLSETELRGEDPDNTKEIDDGGLIPAIFEDTRPDFQHHKATTPVNDLHEGEIDLITLQNRSEYHPTTTAPFNANALTGDVSHPQLDAAAIPDHKQIPSEHGDLIGYDNEGDNDKECSYPGTSTDSSTIQGDLPETMADCLGRSLIRTTMSEHEDEVARVTASGSHPTTVLDDQLILRSISAGKVGDHTGAISNTDDGRTWNAATNYPENRENLNAFKHLDPTEMNLIVEIEGYKPDSQGTETSTSIRELQDRRESNDDFGTRYNQGDSIISMSNPEAQQQVEFIQANTGHEPWTSPLNNANEAENEQEPRDTKESFFERTAHTSARVEDMFHFIKDENKDLLKNINDFSIPSYITQIQTPNTTGNPQGKPADNDEITYEGDGNDPEPSRTYTFKPISHLTTPLKRTISDLEDSDPVDSSPKGKDQ